MGILLIKCDDGLIASLYTPGTRTQVLKSQESTFKEFPANFLEFIPGHLPRKARANGVHSNASGNAHGNIGADPAAPVGVAWHPGCVYA